MILLFTDTITSRLQYIADFIFKENWGIEYSFTTSKKDFINADAIKINYTPDELPGKSINVQGSRLLFEKKIHPQNIEVAEKNDLIFFFQNKRGASNFPFDIFAASFYLLTRYEEYLPHAVDKFGRYGHQQSLAATNNFLKIPLINYWLEHFAEYIKSKFPEFQTTKPMFKFLLTYDVDIAYDWLHKGFIRNSGKVLRLFFKQDYKSISEGFKILKKKEKDPFNIFNSLDELHERYELQPLFFFLISKHLTKYDKNINPMNPDMQSLIKRYAKEYQSALHPSWHTFQNINLLKEEKFLIEEIAEKTINKSRQHYLRFSLPSTYRLLTNAGIKDEYSMGYAAVNGFRASYANTFFWYDIEKEQATDLKIHPFCYMDSNAIFHQKLTPPKALEELKYFYKTCRKVNGTFISIMHNHLMGTNNSEWKKVYEDFLAQKNE